tara:strand:- start:83 stop:1255 length:1173 start_codon:yes stop_codon:yes gene_type:complete
MLSYIIGKYDIDKLKSNIYSFLLILQKNFITTLLTAISSLSILALINNKDLLIAYKDLLLFNSELNLISFIFLTPISRIVRTNIRKYKKIIIIEDRESYKKIKTYKFPKVKFENIIPEALNTKKINQETDLIIIENITTLSKDLFNKIIELKRKGFSIESYMGYCNKELQYIPPDYLNTFLFIENKDIYNKNQLNIRLKRIGDIIFSLILLIITIPLTTLIYLVLLVVQGRPIFYSQERSGLNGSTFKIYKFRSMHINSESGKALWASKNDPRVTRVGSILRISRIDELPQLISVLKGDMSLIGPRPERPEIDNILNKEIENYLLRYLIKPGLSGWAQVNYTYGNSVKDSEIKLGYDFYYIQNYSFWLDLLIFFKTIKLVLNLKGSNPSK